jgi:hypothetical protein
LSELERLTGDVQTGNLDSCLEAPTGTVSFVAEPRTDIEGTFSFAGTGRWEGFVRTRRKPILWTSAALAAAALLCWLFLYPGLLLQTNAWSGVNMSRSEALLVFRHQGAQFHGPGPFELLKATKDPAYLKMRGQLLFGAKLHSLTTTNASLGELAAAFASYANCRTVIVPGEPQEVFAGRFGIFNSSRFSTRWRAAGGITKLLADAGWHVVRLTDGSIAFVSQYGYELLLAAKSAELQTKVLRRFDLLKNSPEKNIAAQILSDLWFADFLGDQIKGQLAEEHYHLVLRQLPYDGYPSWDVRSVLTFPFPEVWTDFTPTLYVNNQVKWSPGQPQSSCAMNSTSNSFGNPITSMSGGGFRNGDVLQCKIDLRQMVNRRPWQMSLWTDKIELQGLKD